MAFIFRTGREEVAWHIFERRHALFRSFPLPGIVYIYCVKMNSFVIHAASHFASHFLYTQAGMLLVR